MTASGAGDGPTIFRGAASGDGQAAVIENPPVQRTTTTVGIGLIPANYHFLSDVIAIGFVGASRGWMLTSVWKAHNNRPAAPRSSEYGWHFYNKAHLKFVALQPCSVCGRQPSDPHHLRFAQPRAIGLKVSDEFTVPLCRGHHRQLHQAGNEIARCQGLQINALEIAKTLWEKTRAPAERA